MADVKISALPAVTTVVPGTDVLPLVSGGNTTKATPNQVVQAVLPAPGAIGGTTPAAITGTNIKATGGMWAATAWSGAAFSDGVLIDYSSPTGRIAVGASDTLNIYINGTSGTLSGSFTSTGLNSCAIGATTASTGAFTTLSASSTVSGTGFSTYLASPPAIGGTAPSTGKFTTLQATTSAGYTTGAGGTITQGTSRTTGVTIDKICGAITLFTAAGTSAYTTFTVTNSTVAATDVIIVNQASGTDKYEVFVTAVGAGSFDITFADVSGTTTEAPVINFAVIKAVTA